jgi:hypothetical protein
MKRERRLAIITTLIILAAAVAGVFLAPRIDPPAVLSPAAADRAHEGSEEIRAQSVGERTWETPGFVLEHELGRSPGATIADPIGVRVDREGAVYVLDWGARCVRKFSPAGDQVMVFGGQAGRGPGEFSNLTDIDVDEDGAVWACDPVNGLVTVFASNGSVRTTVRTGRPPHRLALIGGGAFMVMPTPAGKYLFHRYDGQGAVVDTCGTVVRDQEMMSVILDGRCAGSYDGRFAYAGYRAGILGLFNAHRTPPLFFVNTVEHPGLPKVVAQQAGDVRYIRVSPDAPMVSRSVSIVGREVHVLAGSVSADRNGIMDVYDHDTGAYVRSYEIPVQALAACRTKGMLYAVADTTVRVWSITEVPSIHAGLP